MKKAIVIALVMLLAVGTVFAATTNTKGASKKDQLALGLNLGTNSGLVMNYGMGKFDIEAILGFGIINSSLDAEVAANFAILDVARQAKFAGSMPFTVGAEAGVDYAFKSNALQINFLVPLKLAYTFPKVPVELFLRVAPGVALSFTGDAPNADFACQGSLGVLYVFK